MAERLFDDKREIKSVETKNYIFFVGLEGITKIEVYQEAGQCGSVPWAAIYQGEHLYARVETLEGAK